MNNRIISKGTAIIDNEKTALAGCDSKCELDCIRKHVLLTYRCDLKIEQNETHCKFFIPDC